jgi:hypothetical protein
MTVLSISKCSLCRSAFLLLIRIINVTLIYFSIERFFVVFCRPTGLTVGCSPSFIVLRLNYLLWVTFIRCAILLLCLSVLTVMRCT